MLIRLPEPEAVWTKTASDAVPGIPLNVVKTWLNRPLEDTFWDAETQALLIVALRAVEAWCHISIAPSTWVATMPYLLPEQRIVRRPFLSVESIQYVDPDGNTVTADTSIYQVAKAPQKTGLVRIGYGGTWPATADRADAVTMTVKTGWPLDADDNPVLPDEIMHGIRMTVASLDTQHGDADPSGGSLANTVWGQTHSQAAPIIPQLAQAVLAPWRYQAIYVG